MIPSDERRDFTRVAAGVAVELQPLGGPAVRGLVADVSLSGILVSSAEAVPVGAACVVRLNLYGDEAGVTVQATGAVARCKDGYIAVDFTEVDTDSYEHLRRLVLYNAPDSQRVEDELEDSVGIHRRHEEF